MRKEQWLAKKSEGDWNDAAVALRSALAGCPTGNKDPEMRLESVMHHASVVCIVHRLSVLNTS